MRSGPNATSATISSAVAPAPADAAATMPAWAWRACARAIEVVTVMPKRSDAVRATSASSASAMPVAALRSPITMPSPVVRLAVTTTGPPVREMRGISISDGISAASHAPPGMARRTRTALSIRSPSCITSMTRSPRAVLIGDSTCRWPNGIARLVHWVRPSGPTIETSFTGTVRNETSCIASRSASRQERTLRWASSSSASTARSSRASVSAITRLAEMVSSETPCCST